MLNKIPGAVSLRDIILPRKAKSEKPTHWSEKSVLAFAVVTIQNLL